MNKKRTIITVALIALITSIVGGLVVFAALSETLTIQGAAEFQPETWAVRFQANSLVHPTLANGGLTGGASVETAPTLSNTVIQNFNVVLTQPGDSIRYTFFIENTGTLDAILSTFNAGAPVCTGTGLTAVADAAIVCGPNLTYVFRYIGGDLAVNGLTNGQLVNTGNLLLANTSVEVELVLTYSSAATQLPENPVNISGLGKTLIYTVN